MAEATRRVALLDAPTWIMAHHQTAARGRRGRQWIAASGNLSTTLIYHPQATPAEAAKRSFMAANALYAALALYVPAEKLSLKWPNDVLLNGGKVAGILLESAGGAGPFINWLSIGIGVNLAHVPPSVTEAAFPPTSVMAVTGNTVPATEFLTMLAGAFATQEAKLATLGFDRIREDWLRNAARLGEKITAVTAKTAINGIFDTIDQDGNLVLITGTGPVTIPAADVYF